MKTRKTKEGYKQCESPEEEQRELPVPAAVRYSVQR